MAVPASSFDRLNAAQRAAATHGERDPSGRFRAPPLLVIAGAGTGKTNTLAHRVAHLVLEGIDPARILLLTFTRRAAQEMLRRAEKILAETLAARRGGSAPPVQLPWSGTFHAIGNRVLREYAEQLGLDPGFTVLDRGDAADPIDVLRHELGFSQLERRFPRKDTCLAIYSHRVSSSASLERVLVEHYPWCAEWTAELTQLFRGYVERKQSNGVLDYDDLLLYWRIAVEEPAIAAHLGGRFDHVLVDEYQDTNALQAAILFALKPDGAGVAVVGDDAQAIYSFRAATVDNILEFPARFAPPATIVTLEDNYRSTQPVLDAANALIAEGGRQYQKRLRSVRGEGPRPRLVTVSDDQEQARYVATGVLARRESGIALKRQAVLFRSSHHSDVLELELTRRNIPYVKYGGLKFLEAAHVKDALAVLRWADNPRNAIAAFRVLQMLQGVGPATAQRLFAAFAATGHRFAELALLEPPAAARDEFRSLAALLVALATPEAPWVGQVERVHQWYRPVLERHYDSAPTRANDLAMLEQVAGQQPTRERFLTELALDPPQATGDLAGPPLLDEDYLVLSTVHSAKGQEWDAVYVLNVADGNFPSEFAAGDEGQIDEERRLLYVAMTRAKRELDLVEPLKYYVTQQSRTGDRHVYGARSRFLTPAVLATLEATTAAPDVRQPAGTSAAPAVKVDVAAKLKSLW